MKKIIINGDDFGMNPGCSTAIAKAFDMELITDTTMMANGLYFEEALLLAKRRGFEDRIGVHFNLTEGVPLTREMLSIPAFVIDGRFHKGYVTAPRALNEEEREAVFRELCAQAERLRDAGLSITHADSHHYIHTFTHLAPVTAEVCRRFGIEKIRLNRTFDTPEHPRPTDHRVDNSFWRNNGFITTDHFGRRADFAEAPIPDGTEIIVHPDFDKDGNLIDRLGMRDGYPVGEDLDFAGLHTDRIRLTGYNELE